MTTTLRKKLLTFILPLLVIPILLMLAFYYAYLTHTIKQETIDLSINILDTRTLIIEKTLNSQNRLQDYLHIDKNDHIPPIIIVDKDLKIIADAKTNNIGKDYPQHNKELGNYIKTALINNSTSIIHDQKNQFVLKPLLDRDHKIIAFALCSYKTIFERHMAIINQTFLFITLIIIFITFITIVLTIIFAYNITNPIRSLIKGTQIISNGNLSHTIDSTSDDELGILIESFNRMVQQVKIAENDLQSLNSNLHDKVQEELAKSREKDKILIQQSKMAAMGEMIGNIAHQWRQPLNVLGLLIQNLEFRHLSGELDNAAIKDTAERGNQIVVSMSETIDDFRNFFNPHKKNTLFPMHESVQHALMLIDAKIKEHGISIKTDMNRNVSIDGYPNEFSHVLLNLLNNAHDALLETKQTDKQIAIRVYSENGYAYLSVSDNAGGIPDTIIDKIFDPYFTTKEQGKGTGIGLYMSKMIIETHMNGSLNVKNENNGATFTITMKEAIKQ